MIYEKYARSEVFLQVLQNSVYLWSLSKGGKKRGVSAEYFHCFEAVWMYGFE